MTSGLGVGAIVHVQSRRLSASVESSVSGSAAGWSVVGSSGAVGMTDAGCVWTSVAGVAGAVMVLVVANCVVGEESIDARCAMGEGDQESSESLRAFRDVDALPVVPFMTSGLGAIVNVQSRRLSAPFTLFFGSAMGWCVVGSSGVVGLADAWGVWTSEVAVADVAVVLVAANCVVGGEPIDARCALGEDNCAAGVGVPMVALLAIEAAVVVFVAANCAAGGGIFVDALSGTGSGCIDARLGGEDWRRFNRLEVPDGLRSSVMSAAD